MVKKGVSASPNVVDDDEGQGEEEQYMEEQGFTKDQVLQQIFLAQADVALDEAIQACVVTQKSGFTIDILLHVRLSLGLSNDKYKPKQPPQQ